MLAAVMAHGEPTPEENVLVVLCPEYEVWTVQFIRDDGSPTRLSLSNAYTYAEGFELKTAGGHGRFLDGNLYLLREFISDVDDDGEEFEWEAVVWAPFDLMPFWTPARLELSQKRRRITAARASYQARMRALGVIDADAEHVDPMDVYVRDNWICQICSRPVEPDLAWPAPLSKTLDHVQAVTRGGSHKIDNLQTAHWICNVTKGNRG